MKKSDFYGSWHGKEYYFNNIFYYERVIINKFTGKYVQGNYEYELENLVWTLSDNNLNEIFGTEEAANYLGTYEINSTIKSVTSIGVNGLGSSLSVGESLNFNLILYKTKKEVIWLGALFLHFIKF